MRAHTKKHHTEAALVPLHFLVHPANVKRITRYIESIEPTEGADDSITVDEFFDKHFTGQSRGAVSLKGCRYRENLTQAQLAELTGIPQRHISEMENNKRGIGKENALKLAAALNTDYRAFL